MGEQPRALWLPKLSHARLTRYPESAVGLRCLRRRRCCYSIRLQLKSWNRSTISGRSVGNQASKQRFDILHERKTFHFEVLPGAGSAQRGRSAPKSITKGHASEQARRYRNRAKTGQKSKARGAPSRALAPDICRCRCFCSGASWWDVLLARDPSVRIHR